MYNTFISKRIKGSLVFDIGSNDGEYSALYAQAGAKVVSFEPLCDIIGNANYINNNILVENICVSDYAGEIEFFRCKKNPKLSNCCPKWSSVHKAASRGKFTSVRCDTLQNMISKHGIPVYIKIDVEGHENKVLKTLKTSIDMISMEYTVGFIDEFKECMSVLGDIGHETFIMMERSKDKKILNMFYFDSADQCVEHLLQHPPEVLHGDVLSLLGNVLVDKTEL